MSYVIHETMDPAYVPPSASMDPAILTGRAAPAVDEDIHLVCGCNLNLAYCGADVTGEPWTNRGRTCRLCLRSPGCQARLHWLRSWWLDRFGGGS